MYKFISIFIPLSIKYWYNNYKVSKQFDVAFGKRAYSNRTIWEGKNFLNSNSEISDSYVGLGTYISGNCNLGKIKIGRFCSIGQNLMNKFSLHPSSDFVSTHPSFFSTNKQAGFTFVNENRFNESKYADIDQKYYSIIGNDVWIGNDVKIMEGVRIGDGAIIGTGAIVTKDVEPYTVVGGVPAKIIKKRFNEQQIAFLMEFKWWKKDFVWIASNVGLFKEIDLFMNKYENE